MPSRLSSIAPPPVLIKLTSSCKLNFLIAATESPPPINEKAPLLVALATDFAIAKVPFSKAGILLAVEHAEGLCGFRPAALRCLWLKPSTEAAVMLDKRQLKGGS